MVRVMAWGFLMTLFMAPEMIVEHVCRLPSIRQRLADRPLLTRHLTAFAGALCIELLMLANLIGYAYGLQGAQALMEACNHRNMVVFLAAYTAWLFAGAQVMLLIRQREADAKVKAKAF